MTILLVGVCVNGMIRKTGGGPDGAGRIVYGITSEITCEKCDGKGCPRPAKAEAEAGPD